MPAAAIDRTTLVTGPALATFNGGSFYSKQAIPVKLDQRTMDIANDALGKVDERVLDVLAECTFTPEGRWNAADVAALWPYASTRVGASIFGAADVPLVLSANDGEVHTLIAAAVTKMPNIILSAEKTLVGPVTFRGIRGKGKKWSDANSLYTIATTGGSITDATFSPASIKVQPYVAAWGSIAGFTALQTQNGFTVDFALDAAELSVDSFGIIDMRFRKLNVMVRCVPIGPTSSQILAALKLQGSIGSEGAARGRSLNDDGSGGIIPDLVITGDDGINYVTLSAAALKTGGYKFGAIELRDDEIGFVATRKFTAGVAQPLFTLATS